ncbi:Core-2/I-branching beta-1 6-N-acetylglucosaminyltransferase family protein [Euphorbia peplus]|nr:Core-2/I-branching beta-1 6-N-acetylglucosaminyltransferase family protein [Euphorbia peplus]
MKKANAWQKGVRENGIAMAGYRHRQQQKKRVIWIFVLVMLMVIIFLSMGSEGGSSGGGSAACYFFPDIAACNDKNETQMIPMRQLTDAEHAAGIVIHEILNRPAMPSNNPKIAFMFLTPGPLPFERLWHAFFEGHEGKFTIYVHSSRETPVHVSSYFSGRNIPSKTVEWGKVSMVDAEKRLLSHALLDTDNQHFVLLSDSCVPLRPFDYVYSYLIYSNVSYIDSYEDFGPDGLGRYSDHMMPEVEKKDFRKGSQWFSMKRQHAIVVLADFLYYSKFRRFCRPNMNGRNCYADEHYLPTLFTMIDPGGISKWSITYVDWSERKWHPKTYRAKDITSNFVKNITSRTEVIHYTSDKKRQTPPKRCVWNGLKRPCFLFARKFFPETVDKLMITLSNYTSS